MRKLMDLATHLFEDEYRAASLFGRSAHELLFHLLETDSRWRTSMETGQQPPPRAPDEFPDLPALRVWSADEQCAWETLLASLTATDIGAELSMTSLRGQTLAIPRWRVLQHVLFHALQHHTELAAVSTSAGHSPGDLHFIFSRDGSRGSHFAALQICVTRYIARPAYMTPRRPTNWVSAIRAAG